MMPETLQDARAHIDALDEQIQTLISQRARIAQQVALIKQRAGDSGDHYRPAREAEVLRAAIARNTGPLTDDTIAEIRSASMPLPSQ